MAAHRSWYASRAAAAAALLLVALAARAGAAPADAGGEDAWEIPDMREALADAWSANEYASEPLVRAAAAGAAARGGNASDAALCGVPNVADAGCPALLNPGFGWWTGTSDRRNAFLMSVLVRDNYPMVHNLGADGDDTPDKRALWQCLMRSKWLALGAERVEFYDSPLNTIVSIKSGSDIFVNLRGTWTQAHRDNNMEWRLGGKRKIWGSAVRYHTGWGKSAEDAYQAIKDVVTTKFGISDAKCTVWLSGHSRGGGIALLSAAFADGRDGAAAPCKIGGVWTFGSVKPFDAAFVKAYTTKMGSKTWNWWNQIDVVGVAFVGFRA